MRNLANSSRKQSDIDYANYHVERELRHARLEPVTIEISGEVPTTVGATLGDLTFRRYWTYWVVNGIIPKQVARLIYADPIGQDDVRAYGHCGCVNPDKYAPNDQFVDSYHIDSVAGLRLFVDIVNDELKVNKGWQIMIADVIQQSLFALQQHDSIKANDLLVNTLNDILVTDNFEVARHFLDSIDTHAFNPSVLTGLLMSVTNVLADINQTDFRNRVYKALLYTYNWDKFAADNVMRRFDKKRASLK